MKTTKQCLSIYSPVNIPQLNKVKTWMKDKYGSSYRNIPHISYVFSPIPEFNIPAVKKVLIDYFTNIHKFKLKIGPVLLNKKKKFFYLKVNHPQVINVHNELTLLINKYRNNYFREKDLERMKNNYYSAEELKMLKRFGYARVYKTFDPHISLGDLEKNSENVILDEILKQLQSKLHPLVNKNYLVETAVVVYYQDSSWNSEGKFIWKNVFKLPN
ncbi:MAG TPA: DUF1045 domain-containing protein [Candidatus Dojkabacteria bacterium]|nr:DUF1045 domain-containing protein [Candidatus Dojkabacteria bacterium]